RLTGSSRPISPPGSVGDDSPDRIELFPGVRQDGYMTEIRPARPSDADEMAEVQNAIYRAGLRAGPVDAALVRERYLDMEYGVACTVAERDGRVVGFQSLNRAWPGNPYDVPEGWGIIGTHIRPDAGRRGIGRRLFAVSLVAAKTAVLRDINARIRDDNSQIGRAHV